VLLAVGAALALVLSAGTAHAQALVKRPTLKELTDQADSIFIADCTKRETFFRDGNLISSYRLKPSEYWKGGNKLSSAGELTLEQVGGSLNQPMPITQHDPSSVVLTQGQEILLFTRMPEREKEQAVLGDRPPELPLDLPRVVGGNMGVFSVVRHPETGEKLLAPGTAAGRVNSQMIKRALDESQKNRRLPSSGAKKMKPAGADASADDQIQPFEKLGAVKSRVQKMVEEAKKQ
jgi:hypothetical protein